MYSRAFLVLSLFLSTALPFSSYSSPINNGEAKSTKAPSNLSLREDQEKLNCTSQKSTNSSAETIKETTETGKTNDLSGQETFYPSGGIWWGVRPWGGWGGWGNWGGWGGWGNWGGWGGYRPWYGWRGPHWGGNWRDSLGGRKG